MKSLGVIFDCSFCSLQVQCISMSVRSTCQISLQSDHFSTLHPSQPVVLTVRSCLTWKSSKSCFHFCSTFILFRTFSPTAARVMVPHYKFDHTVSLLNALQCNQKNRTTSPNPSQTWPCFSPQLWFFSHSLNSRGPTIPYQSHENAIFTLSQGLSPLPEMLLSTLHLAAYRCLQRPSPITSAGVPATLSRVKSLSHHPGFLDRSSLCEVISFVSYL